MTYVVLLGGPGAGKGTQAQLLEEALGLPQIATGDLFREHFRNDTELGKVARGYTNLGELVPDEVTIAMVKERLFQSDAADGALLDGFPRTIAQADALAELLANASSKLDIVTYIHVRPECLLQRLAGRWTCAACGHVYHEPFSPPKQFGTCDIDGSNLYQRNDDTEETRKHRIEVYFRQTSPLLDYYRERNLLVEINGEQSIEQVQRDLVEAIKKVA